MAEAYLGHAGRCLFRAYSAGSNPVGQIHPMALETLRDAGVRARALASKSWEVFALPASPKMERVITLCDDAGDRACPIWPGHPETYHWALPDPTSMEGSYLQRKAAFLDVFAQIRQHVDALLMSEPPLGALMEHAARGEVVLTDG
jgi:arsenate reductase